MILVWISTAIVLAICLSWKLSSTWESFKCKEPVLYENGKPVKITPVQDDFDWKHQSPKSFRPFKSGRYNLTMGLRKVDANDWLLMEDTYDDRTKLREKIVNENPKNTVLTLPEAKEGVYELYDTVVGFMAKKYPQFFVMRGKEIMNTVKDRTIPSAARYFEPGTSDAEIIKVLAANVEEDFLLMMYDEKQDQYVLKSGSFAFPSGFDPAYKLNMTLKDIHGPVPLYKEKLEFPMDRFFSKIKVGQWVERANWTIQAHDDLYAPEMNHIAEGVAVEQLDYKKLDFDHVFLRVERQLLTRLPQSNAVLFTIRTYTTPISTVKKEGHEVSSRLVDAISNLPDSMGHYKGRGVWGEAVKAYLQSKQG